MRLDEPGMSRVHARLLPTDEGLLLEDLGSTNGSFLNGKRVLRGEARIGDEIGFDTLRFRLIAPGMDTTPHARRRHAHGRQRRRTACAMLIAAASRWCAAAVLVFAFR